MKQINVYITVNKRELFQYFKYNQSYKQYIKLELNSLIDNILNELKDKKVIGEHGIEVGKKLGYMLSGGETNASAILNEQDLYDLEREIFIDLIKQKPTQERIRHTLDTGKPLFN